MVTTVVSETKAEMRAKIIKQYIKIASESTLTLYMYMYVYMHVHVHVYMYTDPP